MVTISFFKCGFCYTYINVLAVGLFIACDGGFFLMVSCLYKKFQQRKFYYVWIMTYHLGLKKMKAQRSKGFHCKTLRFLFSFTDSCFTFSNKLNRYLKIGSQ